MSRSNIEEPCDRGAAAMAEIGEGVRGRFKGLERLMKAQGLSPMRDNKITVMTAIGAKGIRANIETREAEHFLPSKGVCEV